MPTYRTGDKSFDLEGRGTSATFVDGERRGVLDWEMFPSSTPLGLMVCEYGSRWTAPEQRPITPEELRRLVGDLATAIRAPAELVLRDGTREVIAPRREP